jgi:hypothetical protein
MIVMMKREEGGPGTCGRRRQDRALLRGLRPARAVQRQGRGAGLGRWLGPLRRDRQTASARVSASRRRAARSFLNACRPPSGDALGPSRSTASVTPARPRNRPHPHPSNGVLSRSPNGGALRRTGLYQTMIGSEQSCGGCREALETGVAGRCPPPLSSSFSGASGFAGSSSRSAIPPIVTKDGDACVRRVSTGKVDLTATRVLVNGRALTEEGVERADLAETTSFPSFPSCSWTRGVLLRSGTRSDPPS